MPERETRKDIPIGDRSFYVTKMPAMRANYLLGEARRMLPAIGFGGMIGMPDLDSSSGNFPTEEETIKFQKKCLTYCYENLSGGPAPVINSEGNFGVINLEDNAPAVLALVLAVTLFNIQDFFSGNPSDSSPVGEVQTLFPSPART